MLSRRELYFINIIPGHGCRSAIVTCNPFFNRRQDIARFGWLMFRMQLPDNRVVLIIESKENFSESFGFGFEQEFCQGMGLKTIFMNNPDRIGFAFFLKLFFPEITVSLTRHYPLGWMQSAGIKITW